MPLSISEIKLLQRLLAARPHDGALSQAAERIATNYRVGSRHGRRFLYGDDDFERAANLLRAAGVPLEAAVDDDSRASRALTPGLSEKVGSARPHADSVSVRALGGALAATLDGLPLISRAGSYQVVPIDVACEIDCDVIMVVENLETFRWLDRYRWLGRSDHKVLVVYRGDASTSVGDAMRLVNTRSEPVWWFGDFDPAGLGLASQAPRLERILLPEMNWLRNAAIKGRRGDLFADSAPQWGPTLSAETRGIISGPWRLMNELGLGLPQEWMQDAPTQ